MADYTRDYVLILKESLERKLNLLTQVDAVSDKQKELLKAESLDMDAYDALVEQKTSMADDLETIDSGFASVYDRVSEELKNNKDKYSNEIAVMKIYISKITDLIAKIQADEKRLFEMAKGKLDDRRKEVAVARKNNQAATNYYKSMSQTVYDPQFMDKKK